MAKVAPLQLTIVNELYDLDSGIDSNRQVYKEKILKRGLKQKNKVGNKINKILLYFNKAHFQSSEKQLKNDEIIRDQRCTYNPDQIPPDFTIAKQHQKALQIGPEQQQWEAQEETFCICCARRIERVKLKLWDSPTVFSNYGSGYTLYFTYIKYCIVFLILVFISSGVHNFISSFLYGNDCKEIDKMSEQEKLNDCVKNWVTLLSLGNKKTNQVSIDIQTGLNFLTIIAIIILLQLFRRSQRQIDNECDEASISANDYTLMISMLPKDYEAENDDYDDDLKKFLEENILPSKHIEIKKISMCYNIDEYIKLLDKKQKIIEQFKDQLIIKKKYGQFDTKFKLENHDNQIYLIDQQLQEFQKKFQDAQGREFMKLNFTGYAFVSVNTEQGPNEVYWENLKYSEQQTYTRILFSYIITCILLGICLVIIFYCIVAQRTIKQQQQNNTNSQLISLILGFLIPILNAVLQFFLIKLTEQEKHPTRTDFNINLCRKVMIAQFVNTSLINFICQVWYPNSGRSYFGQIFALGGLAYDQFIIFITSSVIPFAIEAIDIPWLFKQYLRKRLEKDKEACNYTQEELNKLYEEPNFLLTPRYCLILNIMFNAGFYSVILPLALLLSILALILTYWVDKFNLIHRRVIKYGIGGQLSIEMTEMLEYFLPIFSMSNLIFFIIIGLDSGKIQIPNLVIASLVIGIGHAFLPMQEFNEWILKVNDAKPNTQTFEEASLIFRTDFARENPATAIYAREQHMKFVQQYKIQQEKFQKDLILTNLK